jgi:hypothetical protein
MEATVNPFLSEDLEYNLYEPAKKAIELLPNICSPENCIVTSSSGSSVTIIPKEVDYVLQAFPNKDNYERIKTFWNELLNTKDTDLLTYLAPIRDFYDNRLIIKVKKVAPLNNFGGTTKLPDEGHGKMEKDIRQAIECLGEYGLVQGDARIDNIGFDVDTKRYVLYDYDQAKIKASVCQVINNLSMFDESLKFFLSSH